MTTYTLVIGGKTARSTLGQREISVDWNALPETSRDFITRYGLKQYLSDAMAGADNESDATTKVNERVAKLTSGDLSRTKGEAAAKPDTEEGRAIKLAKAAVRELAKEQKVPVTKDQVTDAAKAWVASDPKWTKEAKVQLANEAKLAERGNADEAKALLADLLKAK